MKKLLTILFMAVAMLLPCVALSACGSDDYTGKQFRLTEVSATYDDSVPESVKTAQENSIQAIRTKINGDKAPFCRFYTYYNTMLTNCNGSYRFSRYKVDGANVKIDTSTAENNGTTKVHFFTDNSLEQATLGKENDNLVITEAFNGISVKYVFVPDGEVNESVNEYAGHKYDFVDTSYWVHPTDVAKNEEERSTAEYYNTYYKYGSIKFLSDSSCIVSHEKGTTTWDIKEAQSNIQSKGHTFGYKNVNSDNWSNLNRLYIYGDLIFTRIDKTGGDPKYAYFIKAD